MAGYGVKDANRACRERKDSKPDTTSCQQCDDTGFVMQGGSLRVCPACELDADADLSGGVQ
jgi:hypothetical protein